MKSAWPSDTPPPPPTTTTASGKARKKAKRQSSAKRTGPSDTTTTTLGEAIECDRMPDGVGSTAVFSDNEAADRVEAAMLVCFTDILVTASACVDQKIGASTSEKISKEIFGPILIIMTCKSFCH